MTDPTVIKQAAAIIKEGGLVAFPTETVYGLGANAFDQNACLAIYKAKGRPSNNPLIVHVASINQAEELAIFNDDAYLLSKLWPGPLTMVLPKKKNSKLAECVTAGLNTVAIRIPAHECACELILQSGVPIAAPSANKSGRLSPTSHEHVKDSFQADQIDFLHNSTSDEACVVAPVPGSSRTLSTLRFSVPWAPSILLPEANSAASLIFVINSENTTLYGLESTIIDLSTPIPTILRFGFITPEVIEQILGKTVEIATKSSKIKAPGMMHLHYAPKTPLRINATSLLEGEIGLNFGDNILNAEGSLNLSPEGDLAIAAANLFGCLHKLDNYAKLHSMQRIAVAPIPNKSIGLAINDRLMRAAAIDALI